MNGVPNPIARGGVALAELRPANFRLTGVVLLRKPQVKDEEVWEAIAGRAARGPGRHRPLPGVVGRPGLLRLVPRVDHHLEPPAPRVRVHLPLRVLLLDHPRGCGGPEVREEDSPPEGSP